MASKAQFSGMTGVFLAAAELSKRNYIVTTTARNALGADILLTDSGCRKTFSVQVKTNARTFSFWLIGKKGYEIHSETHFYILINLKKESAEYYIVPSKIISKFIRHETRKRSEWYPVYLKDIKDYKDKWDVFGNKN